MLGPAGPNDRRFYRAWLAAVIPLIVVAVATSCSDDPTPSPPTPDSGAQPGAPPGVCPDASPEAGSLCVVPEGTTCSFGACNESAIAQCTRGTWRLAGNPAPSQDAMLLCPADIPASGTKCVDCPPVDFACRYGTCDGPDATANVARASCAEGLWAIDIIEGCPGSDSGADGGNLDAGADVQDDAGDDVD